MGVSAFSGVELADITECQCHPAHADRNAGHLTASAHLSCCAPKLACGAARSAFSWFCRCRLLRMAWPLAAQNVFSQGSFYISQVRWRWC